MTMLFAEAGANFHEGNALGPNVWFANNGAINTATNPPVPRNGSNYIYESNQNTTGTNRSPIFALQASMVAGYATYTSALGTITSLIGFYDNSNNLQCDVRINSVGQFFFTRNGTTISGNSTFNLTTGLWYYIEFKAIFSTTGTGTCEVRVNGAVVLTATGLTNANTAASASSVIYSNIGGVFVGAMMDFYCNNLLGTLNNNYLGDITVAEIYDNGPGVNAAWPVFQPAFTLTQVATSSGGTAVYTGTITNGASPANAWQGFYFTIAGFVGANNNGTFLCTASNATTLTLANGAATAETHAATASFQDPLQAGIHGGIVDGYATTNVGTRPPADNQYIQSNTPGQLSDFAHQPHTFVGTIAAVIHVIQARKDDAGPRSIAPICLSAGTQETGATIALSTQYAYYSDILETDPHTGAAWTQAGFNAATFGVSEVA